MTGDDHRANGMSARALAELARAGYSSLRHPSMNVEFEVHHVSDEEGYLNAVLKQAAGNSTFFESVTSCGNGVGVTIGTNTKAQLDGSAVRDKGGMQDVPAGLLKGEGKHVFVGSARPNLTFLHETARRFEAIVAIDADPDPMKPLTMAETRQIHHLLHEISRIAVQAADAPLLSVQCPVQLPMGPNAETYDGDIPDAAAKAVRFAIALPRPSATASLDLAEKITAFCQRRNHSLWIRDTRPGRRTGNWFSVLRYPSRRSPHDEPPFAILPVTFVGPARIGSTHAVIKALTDATRLGIAGCSITLLDDLAFIHLQLALPEKIDIDLSEPSSVGKDPAGFIKDVLGITRGHHDVDRGDTHHAADYQTLAGPMLRYEEPDGQRRLAIWFSWQMNRSADGLAAPLSTLATALSSVGLGWGEGGPQPNVEYLVCRDLGNSVLRGKGKLSVPFAFVHEKYRQNGLEPSASQLCVALEDAWKVAVAGAVREELAGHQVKTLWEANIREITVSWREFWLGHWAAPIA